MESGVSDLSNSSIVFAPSTAGQSSYNHLPAQKKQQTVEEPAMQLDSTSSFILAEPKEQSPEPLAVSAVATSTNALNAKETQAVSTAPQLTLTLPAAESIAEPVSQNPLRQLREQLDAVMSSLQQVVTSDPNLAPAATKLSDMSQHIKFSEDSPHAASVSVQKPKVESTLMSPDIATPALAVRLRPTFSILANQNQTFATPINTESPTSDLSVLLSLARLHAQLDSQADARAVDLSAAAFRDVLSLVAPRLTGVQSNALAAPLQLPLPLPLPLPVQLPVPLPPAPSDTLSKDDKRVEPDLVPSRLPDLVNFDQQSDSKLEPSKVSRSSVKPLIPEIDEEDVAVELNFTVPEIAHGAASDVSMLIPSESNAVAGSSVPSVQPTTNLAPPEVHQLYGYLLLVLLVLTRKFVLQLIASISPPLARPQSEQRPQSGRAVRPLTSRSTSPLLPMNHENSHAVPDSLRHLPAVAAMFQSARRPSEFASVEVSHTQQALHTVMGALEASAIPPSSAATARDIDGSAELESLRLQLEHRRAVSPAPSIHQQNALKSLERDSTVSEPIDPIASQVDALESALKAAQIDPRSLLDSIKRNKSTAETLSAQSKKKSVKKSDSSSSQLVVPAEKTAPLPSKAPNVSKPVKVKSITHQDQPSRAASGVAVIQSLDAARRSLSEEVTAMFRLGSTELTELNAIPPNVSIESMGPRDRLFADMQQRLFAVPADDLRMSEEFDPSVVYAPVTIASQPVWPDVAKIESATAQQIVSEAKAPENNVSQVLPRHLSRVSWELPANSLPADLAPAVPAPSAVVPTSPKLPSPILNSVSPSRQSVSPLPVSTPKSRSRASSAVTSPMGKLSPETQRKSVERLSSPKHVHRVSAPTSPAAKTPLRSPSRMQSPRSSKSPRTMSKSSSAKSILSASSTRSLNSPAKSPPIATPTSPLQLVLPTDRFESTVVKPASPIVSPVGSPMGSPRPRSSLSSPIWRHTPPASTRNSASLPTKHSVEIQTDEVLLSAPMLLPPPVDFAAQATEFLTPRSSPQSSPIGNPIESQQIQNAQSAAHSNGTATSQPASSKEGGAQAKVRSASAQPRRRTRFPVLPTKIYTSVPPRVVSFRSPTDPALKQPSQADSDVVRHNHAYEQHVRRTRSVSAGRYRSQTPELPEPLPAASVKDINPSVPWRPAGRLVAQPAPVIAASHSEILLAQTETHIRQRALALQSQLQSAPVVPQPLIQTHAEYIKTQPAPVPAVKVSTPRSVKQPAVRSASKVKHVVSPRHQKATSNRSKPNPLLAELRTVQSMPDSAFLDGGLESWSALHQPVSQAGASRSTPKHRRTASAPSSSLLSPTASSTARAAATHVRPSPKQSPPYLAAVPVPLLPSIAQMDARIGAQQSFQQHAEDLNRRHDPPIYHGSLPSAVLRHALQTSDTELRSVWASVEHDARELHRPEAELLLRIRDMGFVSPLDPDEAARVRAQGSDASALLPPMPIAYDDHQQRYHDAVQAYYSRHHPAAKDSPRASPPSAVQQRAAPVVDRFAASEERHRLADIASPAVPYTLHLPPTFSGAVTPYISAIHEADREVAEQQESIDWYKQHDRSKHQSKPVNVDPILPPVLPLSPKLHAPPASEAAAELDSRYPALASFPPLHAIRPITQSPSSSPRQSVSTRSSPRARSSPLSPRSPQSPAIVAAAIASTPPLSQRASPTYLH
jgi:hypothetical protein